MESINCIGFTHEYPHEKDGAGLTALEDFLLSLCFCPACIAKGRAVGVDMEHVRERVRADAKKFLALPREAVPSQEFLTLEPNFFADGPNLMAFLTFRTQTVTSLVPNVGSWLFGADLQAISRSCGSALLCSYDSDAGQTGRDMATSRAELDPGCRAYTGMRAFTPEYAGKEALLQKVGASLQAGSDGFVF